MCWSAAANIPIPDREREKIALFCNVRKEHVIPAYDLKTIYEAPLAYHRAGWIRRCWTPSASRPRPKPNLSRWEDVMDRLTHPEGEVRVAIVGKYTQLEDAYKSIAEALTHGGMANRTKVKAEWIDSEIFEREDPRPIWKTSTPSWCPAALANAAPKARSSAANSPAKSKVPYLGICLGMQMAVIEAARNLAGVPNAGSEEFDHEKGGETLYPGGLSPEGMGAGQPHRRRKADDAKGGTMRLGAYTANLKPARSGRIYGGTVIEERHRHRYEVDIQVSRPAGKMRPDLLRHVARRPPARDRRGEGPPLVHRRAVPPRAEVETLRPASAVRRFREGGGGGVEVGVREAPTPRFNSPIKLSSPPLANS
jgi:CTP synthase